MQRKLFVIICFQEYATANHKDLWNIMADTSDDLFVILNIPADYVVSNIKKSLRYRISDARKGLVKLKENLFLGRPMFFLRHELAPNFLYKFYKKSIWKWLRKNVEGVDEMEVDFIYYDPIWASILRGSRNNIKMGYYLVDEVKKYAHNDKDNAKKVKLDDIASSTADAIFTASQDLAESRLKVNKNVYFTGNGADLSIAIRYKDVEPLDNSVAFIGNFRNWIDKELMETIISKRPDVDFYFVGTVENDMNNFFTYLLDKYDNTFFFGKTSKERVGYVYKRFRMMFIPYYQNHFIWASRPLKIIESVMAGTPAVTVPVSGYNEHSFLKFARNFQEFSDAIDYFLKNGIDKQSDEYQSFCSKYSWQNIAKTIIEKLK